jgi:hypothetical protein
MHYFEIGLLMRLAKGRRTRKRKVGGKMTIRK